MKKLKDEEKFLKRFFKKRVSLDEKTIVKFLITGLMSFSLVGCGGGGGGGGSSSPSVNNQIKPNVNIGTEVKPNLDKDINLDVNGGIKPNIDEGKKPNDEKNIDINSETKEPEKQDNNKENKETEEDKDFSKEISVNTNNEGIIVGEKNSTLKGSIKGDKSKSGLVAVTVINSNLDNKAAITLDGENAIGIYGNANEITESAVTLKSVYTIRNSGKIELNGKNSIGIKVENGYIAENNGEIVGTGKGVQQFKENGEEIENSSGTVGMYANNGSKVINNKNIILNGAYTVGLFGENNSTVENNGTISIKSNLVYESDFDGNEYYEGKMYSNDKGILVSGNSKGINKGIIKGEGRITGIWAGEGSKGINEDKIELSSLKQKLDGPFFNNSGKEGVELSESISEVIGMYSRGEDSSVVNNKDIVIEGNAYGIIASQKSKGENNGNIDLQAQKIDAIEYTKEDNQWKYKEYVTEYCEVTGIEITDNGIGVNNKNGNININGAGYGITANYNSKGENNGVIKLVSGIENTSGKLDMQNEKVDNVTTKKDKKRWAVSVGMSGENNSTIINNNKIDIKNYGAGMYIESNSEAFNNKKIVISNDNKDKEIYDAGAIGIYSKGGGNIENSGDIIINTIESKNILDEEYGYYGIYSEKKENKGKIVNSGKIDIKSEFLGAKAEEIKSGGIVSSVDDVTNEKEISVEGKNTVGIKIENNLVAENKGDIKGFGKGVQQFKENGEEIESSNGTIGMYANNESKVINNKNITLDGAYTVGLFGKNNSTVENNETISIKSNLVNESDFDGKEYYEGKMYSNDKGILVSGNSKGINKGIIKGEGRITGIWAGEGSEGINEDKIVISSLRQKLNQEKIVEEDINHKIVIFEDLSLARGMRARGDKAQVINEKVIKLKGKATGMDAIHGGKAFNNGKINLNSQEIGYVGYSKGDNLEEWKYGEVGTNYSEVLGMKGYNNSTVTNNEKGIITVNGDGTGILVIENSKGENKGTINLEAKSAKVSGSINLNNGEIKDYNIPQTYFDWTETYGMTGDENSGIINNGMINILNSGIGMSVTNNSKAINNKEIVILNKNKENISSTIGIGIMSFNGGKIENNDKIYIDMQNTKNAVDRELGYAGMLCYNENSAFQVETINTGKITVLGEDAVGMYARLNAKAVNKGIINIDGDNAVGMIAGENSIAINEEKGIINVGMHARAAMLADGPTSKVVNKGTINIYKRDGLTDANKESIAIQAINGGAIENTGKINISDSFVIEIIGDGEYIVGTEMSGEYGTITAKSVNLNTVMAIDSDITKAEYKDEIKLENVVSADSIEFGDNFEIKEMSLFYNGKAELESNKEAAVENLNVVLTRNDKTFEDFSTDENKEVAKIFSPYQENKKFSTLSDDGKEVIRKIDGTKEHINKNLSSLNPTIYGNLPREILSLNEIFKAQNETTINGMGNSKYNFTVLGEYQDIETKNNINGYKSKLSGFVGAVDLGNNTYGTIGYGYDDIDYKDNGKGKIHSLHLGVNKAINYQGIDVNVGVGGEYNFHKNTREIDALNRSANSKFNSYAFGLTTKASKTFGEEYFVKPYVGFDVTHMNYEKFKETGANSVNVSLASQNYTSVLPKVGMTVGSKVNNINAFVTTEYSYEVGNMKKAQKFSYEGFDGTGEIRNNGLEKGALTTKVGVSYTAESYMVEASVGKNFGKRDNSFASLKLGYKF